jgi:hypothetical protein
MEKCQLRISQEKLIGIEEIKKLISTKGQDYEHACEVYTKGIILTTSHRNPKQFFLNSQENIKKIIFLNKEDLKKKEFSHLLDKNKNLNLRDHKTKKNKILIFNKNTDVESICKYASEQIKKLKIKYLYIEEYKGNPLDSRKNNSRLIVRNPNPLADKNDYKAFGEVIEYKRELGVDTIIYKSLFNILPVIEELTKWKKNLNVNKFFFFLNPNENNLAAPSYCFLKKYYIPDEDYKKLLNQLKDEYPKKIVKVVKKTFVPQATTEVLNPPIDLIASPIKPNKKRQDNTPKSTSKLIQNVVNKSLIDIFSGYESGEDSDDTSSKDTDDDEEDESSSNKPRTRTKTKSPSKTQNTPKKVQKEVLKNQCIQIKSNKERCKGKTGGNNKYCNAHRQNTPQNNSK